MKRSAVAFVLFALAMLAPITSAHASTPGKNGLILFQADLGRGFQLFTVESDGKALHQLTNVYGDAASADWSPDGKRIVFEHDWERSGIDHGRIVLMNADGTHVHDVTTEGRKHQPAFTPDGHHIVYECECHPDGIFIMRTDGTHRRRLTTNPFNGNTDTDPNVSPDGATVTFVRHKVEELKQALFAVGVDGSNLRQLTSYDAEVAIKHDWAPDGRHILICVNADYPHGRSPNVATIRPDGTHVQQLTSIHTPNVGAFAGSYSPDGRWIVFRAENLSTEKFRLVRAHPDGSHRSVIFSAPFAARSSDWGPQA